MNFIPNEVYFKMQSAIFNFVLINLNFLRICHLQRCLREGQFSWCSFLETLNSELANAMYICPLLLILNLFISTFRTVISLYICIQNMFNNIAERFIWYTRAIKDCIVLIQNVAAIKIPAMCCDIKNYKKTDILKFIVKCLSLSRYRAHLSTAFCCLPKCWGGRTSAYFRSVWLISVPW